MSNTISSGLDIPAGYYRPFASVSDNDHSAWILISTALGLACVSLFSGIRVFVRKVICPGVGLDDYSIIAATVIGIAEYAVLMRAASDGLGKSIELIPPTGQVEIQKLHYVGLLLFILALGLSKISVVSLLLRLTPSTMHKRVFKGTAIFIAIWMVASFFALAFECNISHPWMVLNQQCSGMLLRWQVICAFDIATEVLITSMSVLLIAKIHASLATKAAVVAMFAPRLLMIVPIVFRILTFHEAGRDSNFTLTDSTFLVWTQAELSYSLISATIPTMRPFISNLSTQFGGIGENESMKIYSFSKASTKISRRDGSFLVPNLNSKPSDLEAVRKQSASRGSINFSGNPHYYNCDVWSSNHASREMTFERPNDDDAVQHQKVAPRTPGSSQDDDIRPMMIRKEVTYVVHHQNEES